MKTRFLTVLTISLFAIIAQAQDGEKFADHKKKMSQELEKRIGLLQTEKSCIDGAADQNAVKSCKEASKAAHEKLQAEHRQQRSQNIDEQMKKLQEEKQKLQQK